MPDLTSPKPAATRRIPLAIGAVVIGVGIGFAGFYVPGALKQSSGDPACRGAVTLAQKIAPLAHGEVAALTMATSPLRLPDLAFADADGQPRKLSDWRGKTVLLNLWATWCVPCRKEMPALEQLQTKLAGPNFEVVAINIDTRDPDKPRAFLKNVGAKHLAYYFDRSAHAFEDLRTAGKAIGMPTTVLIDRVGCEIGNMAGPAAWASEDGVKLVSAAIAADNVTR
jgi:thiol-disulfide isomerase/thioredoxin